MSETSHYPKPDQKFDFAQHEKETLKFWEENKIFEKSVQNRDFSILEDEEDSVTAPKHCCDNPNHKHDEVENNEFVFYDGPPFANGLPHYGHLLTGYIKDIFARYQTSKGKKVERRFGWDTHGLPVEMEVEKELGVSGQIAINEYGIGKFNESCKTSVMKYADNWKEYVGRQGRWVDFDRGYKTMDVNYMESVIWAFKELHNKGLMYEDYRVVPYSWACQTPLSNFETKMDNAYREKKSKAVTVKFELEEGSIVIKGHECKKIYLSVWTTTPWTLPSNLALGVGKNIIYEVVEKDGELYVISEFMSASKIFDEYETVAAIRGKDLLGLKYKPLFPYLKEKASESKASYTILHGDFVTTEDGTGVVHLAPGFGEDDQLLCKANGIPTLCPVDAGGKFTTEMFDLEGLSIKGKQVFKTNDDIIKYLKIQNNWLKTEQYIHSYPHCWRTDTPLIYKAVSSWYVKVTDFKDDMIKANQEINWIPGHIKDGQFGKWLEGARDWSITRNRFWGCPVPVWKSDNPEFPRLDVYGSLDQIEADFGVRPDNLHRPFIDEITRLNPDDPRSDKNHQDHKNCSTMRRVTDVLDCWFESGSMPYAQAHYPFENKEWFEKNFPADFITEYVAQTRGWFYTLLVLSVGLFNKPPFKNVICHGTILDEKAQKLSKRLKNYADPLEVFSQYGSDAMRFYMISQPVMRGQDLKIDKDGKAIKETLRLSLKPLINAYNFFCLYANSDGIKASRIAKKIELTNIMDRYILAKLKSSVEKMDQSLANYDTVSACEEFTKFFEVLNNWYIRRSRNRFWKSEIDSDKTQAYDVLYTCILTICESSAALLPFTTEKIWRDLTQATS